MPPLTPSSTRAPESGVRAAPGPAWCSTGPGRWCSPASSGVTPPRGSPLATAGLLDGAGHLGRTLPVQLLLGELLQRHGERLAVGAGVDHRRDVLADALAELGVVAVDLAGAARGPDHQRVLGVDPRQQVVDAGFDHAWLRPSLEFTFALQWYAARAGRRWR